MEQSTAKYALIALVVMFIIVISWDVYEYSQLPDPADITKNSNIKSMRLIFYYILTTVLSVATFAVIFSYSNVSKSKSGSIITGIIALLTLLTSIYGLYELQVWHSSSTTDATAGTNDNQVDAASNKTVTDALYRTLFVTGLLMLGQGAAAAVYVYWIHKGVITRGSGGLMRALNAGPERRSELTKSLVE